MSIKFIVHGKSPCPYCRMAVDAIRHKGYDLDYYDTTPSGVPNLQKMIESKFGVVPKTFPQIIKVADGNETYIGGWVDLKDSFTMEEDIFDVD